MVPVEEEGRRSSESIKLRFRSPSHHKTTNHHHLSAIDGGIVDVGHHGNTQGERAAVLVQNSSSSGSRRGEGANFEVPAQQHPRGLRMDPKLGARWVLSILPNY